MSAISDSSKVKQLARDLGLPIRGNSLNAISNYALDKVTKLIEGFPVENLDVLRRLLTSRLSLKVELIQNDEDVDRIADIHEGFAKSLRSQLRLDFLERSTEGITLERENVQPGELRYLAVIDARGERLGRAFFTTWHEIAHLLVHPPQRSFEGFRRTPTRVEINKDPIESIVDHVAGRVAFYAPLFEPVLAREIESDSALTFGAIERAREIAAPSASFYAAALGSIPHTNVPILFVAVELALKKHEARVLASGQGTFLTDEPQSKLRAVHVIRNALAERSALAIQRNMRVPETSVLYHAFLSDGDVTLEALEDQSWWVVSGSGSLPSLPIHVQATKRGRFVYGLISPARRPVSNRRTVSS